MVKKMEANLQEESKLQSFVVLFQKPNQECKKEKQREESNMKKTKRIATVGHILNTSWSPFYVYYMLFRILGSQESNASNGVQIGAEMKKLWALEDNRAQPKDNFASCEITKVNLRNQGPTCEMDNSTCEIFASHISTCRIHCVLPDICDRIFYIFSSDICCLNPYFLLVIHQSQDSLVRK